MDDARLISPDDCLTRGQMRCRSAYFRVCDGGTGEISDVFVIPVRAIGFHLR